MAKPGEVEDLEDDDESAEGAAGSKKIDIDEEEDDAAPGKKDDKGGRTIDLDEEEEIEEESGKKPDNAAFAKMRIQMKKLKKENEELKSKPAPAAPAAASPAPAPAARTYDQREVINGIEVPKTEEEWDVLVKKNWKAAVDLRGIIAARQTYATESSIQQSTRTMEESKQRVAQRHPELLDPNSEKTKIFLQVLDDNPDFRTNPKGPLYAMRELEDRMESLGYKREDIVRATKAGQSEEALRQSRVVVSGAQGRSAESTGRQVTLTKDDMEFCKINEIDPKVYAQNKFAMSKSKGSV